MRVALFGGSFDPPHTGHLRIALTARARLQLARVLLAPTGRQPLKAHEASSFADRMAMLRLLIAAHPGLAASDIDAPRPGAGHNYTVETLRRLRPMLPPEVELFFLAGADTFLTLSHWHEPEALLRPAGAGGLLDGWILAARPGFSLDALASALPPGYTLAPVAETVGCAPENGTGDAPMPLFLLPDLDDPSTATRIRAAFAAGEAPPHLAPEVEAYIRAHGLYPASTEAGRMLR